MINSRSSSNTGYKGIHWNWRTRKYDVYLGRGTRIGNTYLGSFYTRSGAIQARERFIRSLY